jgi:sodium-dependent dicarboxylate transporter 2/3/5
MFTRRRSLSLAFGIALFAGILAFPAPEGMPLAAWRTTALVALMAAWWMTEAIPIGATALLPLLLLPPLRVASLDAVASPYASPVVGLFLGGFLMAHAIERAGLHRRVALLILSSVSASPAAIVAGFMTVAAALSMWMSNTATAVMLFPLATTTLSLLGHPGESGERTERNFAAALMLGIAYACSIGGLGTLIGSPPNALLVGFVAAHHGTEIGFARWMGIGMPIVVIGLPVTWWLLTRWLYPIGRQCHEELGERLERERAALGTLTSAERRVGLVFASTALAWLTRPLWQAWAPGMSDTGIALLAALSLFAVPVAARGGDYALDRAAFGRIPWEVLILVGGGLSLATSITGSGLAEWLGARASALKGLPLPAVIGTVTVAVVFATEGISNTAAAATFLPMLSALAVGLDVPPMKLLVPATLAASCAFMMPVATPPNAIAIAGGHVTVGQMVRAGVVLNLLFAALVTVLALVTIR